jgi:hypothetical protein
MTAQLQNPGLFDETASLLPAEQREQFYRRMAHLEHLGPNDEILQIAEAMGFLALLTRQTPAQVAAERVKLEMLLQNIFAALKTANETALACQCDLDQRLKDLPTAIAQELNPERIAALLSENLRQHFQQTGIPAVAESIAEHSNNLLHASQQLRIAVATFVDPDNGAVIQLNRALIAMRANLDNAANHVRSLSHALVKDLRHALAILCFGAMAIGFFLGINFPQWIGHRQ